MFHFSVFFFARKKKVWIITVKWLRYRNECVHCLVFECFAYFFFLLRAKEMNWIHVCGVCVCVREILIQCVWTVWKILVCVSYFVLPQSSLESSSYHTQCNKTQKIIDKNNDQFAFELVFFFHSLSRFNQLTTWITTDSFITRTLPKKMIKKKSGAHNTHYTLTWLTSSIRLFVSILVC